jgi:putative ABC transport system permease protein
VSQPVPISLEDGYAERNTIAIGDTLLFNVQGMMLTTVVASLRDVDWAGVQTNFLVLFPKGVLEEAPQFHVLLTHVPNTTVSAQFQQAMVRQFPNVSMVDLGLILTVLDDISAKIGFVIRFMAGFSILTGLIVLIASVLISKYQRIQESILLRTLGASRRQILIITALEYLFLGTLAAFTGILLALIGSWALATFNFEMAFNPILWPVGVVFLTVTFLTVFIGLANSWGILSRSPLEVLRQDV